MAVTEQKKAIVAQMKETLSEAKGAVLIGYTGLTVAQATDLRRKMLAEGVEYKVIKNTLTRIAANELNLEGFAEHLEGPTALATSKEDAVAPARVIEQFIKTTEKEVVTVKAGIVEGEVMDAAGIKAIANLLPHTGSCQLDDTYLENASPRQLALLCGYIPQKSGISIDLTLLDVVLMGFNPKLSLLQSPTEQMKKEAFDAL